MLNSSLVFWELTSFVVLLALVLLFLRPWVKDVVRYRNRARREAVSPSLEVLDRRYASGELTREEYLAIKSDLTR